MLFPKMLSIYPSCFFKGNNGYSVIFPDLNYLATQGDDLEEAIKMAVDCLAGYLYSCKQDKETIPAPSNITDIDIASLLKELSIDDVVKEAFVDMVSVDVESYGKEYFNN